MGPALWGEHDLHCLGEGAPCGDEAARHSGGMGGVGYGEHRWCGEMTARRGAFIARLIEARVGNKDREVVALGGKRRVCEHTSRQS